MKKKDGKETQHLRYYSEGMESPGEDALPLYSNWRTVDFRGSNNELVIYRSTKCGPSKIGTVSTLESALEVSKRSYWCLSLSNCTSDFGI